MSFRGLFIFYSGAFILVILIACGQEGSNSSEELELQPVIEQQTFSLPSVPDTVYFCESTLLIDNFDLKERLDKELIVNTFYHSSTIQIIKRSHRHLPLIEKILKDNDIPDDFKYLCIIESALTQATSPSGAKGFWQFMPQTAKEFGLRVDNIVDERLNIEKSTEAACAYLNSAYKIFNDWTLVAASYNMGMKGVELALEDQDVNSYFDLHLNTETSRYIFRILALKLILENPRDYGFIINPNDLYDPINTREVKVENSIQDLKKWAKGIGTTYHLIKVLNPWIIGDRLTIKNEPIIIEVPV